MGANTHDLPQLWGAQRPERAALLHLWRASRRGRKSPYQWSYTFRLCTLNGDVLNPQS